MAFNYRRLSSVSFVGTKGTTDTIYTNPAGVTSYVRQIWFHVPAMGLATRSGTSLKLFFVPQQGAAARSAQVTSQIFARSSLTSNETYLLDCGVPGLMLTNQYDLLKLWHRSKTTITYTIMGGAE